MTRRRLKMFETEVGARRWCREADHARTFNRLPLLDVEQDKETGQWWAVNPDVDARPGIPRRPMK